MYLFHYTTMARLFPDGKPSNIVRRGLTTKHADWYDGIWLTRDPCNIATRVNGTNDRLNWFRITLDVNERDKKLVPWLNIKPAFPFLPDLGEGECDWFVYHGSIPTSRFIRVDIVPAGQPWWMEQCGDELEGDTALRPIIRRAAWARRVEGCEDAALWGEAAAD